MSVATYPVHVDAELDSRVSRWLWLVKWLLVIPHYVVLCFLWVAFAVLSVVAFFAILFTGRYPRAIFDFNVGVLRWQWRVSYYAYGALATDRYPPFTLHEVPDYPAHLRVDYPEHLSRGLVLVKWWLLAIPHYLVVALLVGGGLFFAEADDRSLLATTGLIPLLAVVAGVVLLIRGTYPRGIFDLLLGLNRWVLRVAGYAALMTDTYPPFRLDQGGHEDGAGTLKVSPEPPTGEPSRSGPKPPPHSRWTAGRVASLVVGCVVGLGAVWLAVPGVALLVADQIARDDQGFVMSPEEDLSTSTYALVSEDLQLHTDVSLDGALETFLGDVKVTAESDDGTAVFIGVAPAEDVRGLLDGIAYATLVDFDDGEPVYRTTAGSAPTWTPQEQDWTAQTSGTGTQELTWTPEDGDWAVVVMNDDAVSGVDVTVAAGAEAPALAWVVATLLTVAVLGLAVATILIVVPLWRVSHGADVDSGVDR